MIKHKHADSGISRRLLHWRPSEKRTDRVVGRL